MSDITDKTTKDEGIVNNVVVDTGKTPEVRVFTQEHLDSILKSRLTEQKTKLEQRFTVDLDAKIKETRDSTLSDLDKQVEERISKRDAEIALKTVRSTIASEFNLDEVQASRLTGTTEEELKADAELLFGKFKPKVEPDDVLEAAKAALVTELGITEKQAERLQGKTADELRADAIELYGIKEVEQKKPPVLLDGSGNKNSLSSLLANIENMSPSEIRKAKFLATK